MTSDAALAARADAEVGSTGARALWPYLRPHRRTLGLVVVLSFLGAGAALALPLLVRAVLDGLGSGASVTGVVAVLAVLMVAGALLDGLSRYLLQRTAEGVVLDARIGLGGRLLRLPVAEYDRRRTGDLISASVPTRRS
jgi:ABC-type multidrug transport system fused ATPase/permease subunit